MTDFHGREGELAILARDLRDVRATGQGRLVLVKGRRRVGKSWLIEEFCRRAGIPALAFLAARQRPTFELERFREALARSELPRAADAPGVSFRDWESALVLASGGATRERPIAIVLDEFPYLVETQEAGPVEASVNAAWERSLSRLPIILFLVGSDLTMMDMLTEHGRPLYGRPTRTMTVQPLTIAEVAGAIGISGAAAIDAYHVIGGFPRLTRLWRQSDSLRSFLARALIEEDSPFVSTGARILDAEFPENIQARTVLATIGAGERTYGNIARTAGVQSSNLRRSLTLLETEKRVITSEAPLSTLPSTDTRYLVGDPYLRFYLRFVEPNHSDIERGRHRVVVDRVDRDWQSYLGFAVEPFVRASIERLLPLPELGDAAIVGSYWTRSNDPQIDLVGTDGDRGQVRFIGSIKWRANRPFRAADLDALRAAGLRSSEGDRRGVPGTGPVTPLVAAARTGIEALEGLTRSFGPDELIAAWG